MKVGVRLGLGFMLMILAGLAVAILGRIALGSIDDEMHLLVSDRMVKVGQLNQVKNNLNQVARSIRNMILSNDDQDMQTEKQRIETTRAQNTTLLEQLNTTIQTAEGRQLLQKVMQIRPSYNTSTDKTIAFALAHSNEEASIVLRKETQPILGNYLQALDDTIKLQEKLMNDAAQDVQASTSWTGKLLLAIASAAALIGAIIAWTLTRSITRQLGGEPDYTTQVVHEIAAGNLAVDIHTRSGDTTSLLAQIKGMRDSLAKVVAHVRESSEAVASASTQISEGNNDLSGRTEEQASALQQTAASMEQLSSTVKQNADNARQANQLAQSASTVALQGGDVVAQVVDTMKGINDSSKKIADIISVIDGIAFQTNILALNAAVEAARAGEQGRGFAVVASEVRSLAGRSADAAKEIKQLITDSVDRVEQGSTLVGQAGVTMSEVVSSIRRVTDIMGEISAASSEQSAGVSQVGEAVTQMDQTTQQNAALVEEMAAAASSLSSQARDLVQTVAVFKLGADYAVSTVRAPRTSPHITPPAPSRTKPAPIRHSAHTLPAAAPAGLAAPGAQARTAKAAPRSTSPAPKAAPHKALPHNASSTSSAKADNMDDWESF
ncbi:methyl-accepting chemotaxis protein [Simplicispira psychrophila]|uniref:methyl-accepting chemotaxis protein n=1 Tax=Simplicispira psychrophila TaxID=80882 RepID=UPI002481499B|nr:methyl-accepting chemotaxis protein [Simplicispira psychrophila]